MNFILRIHVPSTLNVVAQHIEVLIVILDLAHSSLVQYILTLKTYQHIN